MKVLIIGGGGMIGQKLAQSLTRTAKIANNQITSLTLADAITPADIAELSSFQNLPPPLLKQSPLGERSDLAYQLPRS